mmetsp:Transcript_17491/g.54621  ORF Transcript_17491/g.54621 Transcript_17491/m.54621 type:complete len:399 (+) Transcript_17491:159-1355(+)
MVQFGRAEEVAALSEDELRSLDRDELSELLARWEEALSEAQTATVVSMIEAWAAEEEEEEDEGFVLDKPLTPKTVKPRRKRSSLSDSVWTARSEAAESSVCSSSEQAYALEESPTVSTTQSVAEDPIDNRFRRAGEFSNAPTRFEASVDNLDHECNAKRRAKAADDAAEFARALRWVVDLVAVDAPADLETRPEESFGEHLKDGVLLCQLLNKIKPGTVKKVSNHSSLAFHQMANVTNFLRGCQELGVSKRDCFDTVDLQQLRDLSKVYETLLMLSQTVEKTVPDFAGPYLYSKKREERKRRGSRGSSHPGSSHPGTPKQQPPTPPPPLTTKTLDDLVSDLGLEKYREQLSQVADDPSDLAEMTNQDFDAFIKSSKMPALKARRFKKALIDLGAQLIA